MSKWLLLIQQFSIPVLFVVAGIGLGLYFDRRVLKRLSVFAEKTAWKGDDLIIDNVKGISFIWFALGGCYLASVFLTFQGVVVIHRALYAVFLLSITLLVSRLAVSFLQLYSSREGTSPMCPSILKVSISRLGIGSCHQPMISISWGKDRILRTCRFFCV